MTTQLRDPLEISLARIGTYPRFRWMGSKFKLASTLLRVFAELPGATIADPFFGSGIVAYTAKTLGRRVICGDYLTFSATLAEALIENSTCVLDEDAVDAIVTTRGDGRSFVRDTFGGIFFELNDLAFIDRAWSSIDKLDTHQRAIAISALCLASARKQPRGVFTVGGLRYDDGRRQLTASIESLFREAVDDLNGAVFDNGVANRAYCGDAMNAALDEADIIYLDPPYTPQRDDNDYIKRYHFLEGLSKYWRGERIRHDTKVRKIEKRFTPFAYKHTVVGALEELIRRCDGKTVVLSYSSNAYPDATELRRILRKFRREVNTIAVDHRYHFGTHERAERRVAQEYLFVCR